MASAREVLAEDVERKVLVVAASAETVVAEGVAERTVERLRVEVEAVEAEDVRGEV